MKIFLTFVSTNSLISIKIIIVKIIIMQIIEITWVSRQWMFYPWDKTKTVIKQEVDQY